MAKPRRAHFQRYQKSDISGLRVQGGLNENEIEDLRTEKNSATRTEKKKRTKIFLVIVGNRKRLETFSVAFHSDLHFGATRLESELVAIVL